MEELLLGVYFVNSVPTMGFGLHMGPAHDEWCNGPSSSLLSRPGWLNSGGPLCPPPSPCRPPDRNRRRCRRRRATVAVLGSLAGRCCSSRSLLSILWPYTSSPVGSSSPAPSSTSTAAATTAHRKATSPPGAPPGLRPPSTASLSSYSTRFGGLSWIPHHPRPWLCF